MGGQATDCWTDYLKYQKQISKLLACNADIIVRTPWGQFIYYTLHVEWTQL